MSPEQAEGRPADARSDIFAFGSILYEMLAGRRAFPGTSVGSILGAILHKDPKPIDAPPGLAAIVFKAWRKLQRTGFRVHRNCLRRWSGVQLGLEAEAESEAALESGAGWVKA